MFPQCCCCCWGMVQGSPPLLTVRYVLGTPSLPRPPPIHPPAPLYFIIYLFIYFWPRCLACGILVPQPGIQPVPPAVEAWSLNHWTAREVPSPPLLNVKCFPCVQPGALTMTKSHTRPALPKLKLSDNSES